MLNNIENARLTAGCYGPAQSSEKMSDQETMAIGIATTRPTAKPRRAERFGDVTRSLCGMAGQFVGSVMSVIAETCPILAPTG